jgi:hypothetical protein
MKNHRHPRMIDLTRTLPNLQASLTTPPPRPLWLEALGFLGLSIGAIGAIYLAFSL